MRNLSIILLSLAILTGCGENPKEIIPVKEIGFTPETYQPDETWQGKTVLLETFSGSECPPCAGVDLAIKGLTLSFDRDQLAIITYQIPIPGPDPMMSRASHFRTFYYDAYRAPMTFFDGTEKFRGGGKPEIAKKQFDIYRVEIISRLNQKPDVMISADGSIEADSISISITTDAIIEGASLNIVIVQKKIEYLGRNRIPVHEMVARHHEILGTYSTNQTIGFNAGTLEEVGRKWLANVERNYDPYKFKEKRYQIDRSDLAAVIFVQNNDSREVLNAVTIDINSK